MRFKDEAASALQAAFERKIGQLYDEYLDRAVIARGNETKMSLALQHFTIGSEMAAEAYETCRQAISE